jgi:outer membrane protein insertion porin family
MLMLVFLAVPRAGFASPEDYVGKQIVAIEFDPPNQPLLPSDLDQSILPLKPGYPLQLYEVRLAIENLYSTGRYEDIAVDAKPSGNGVVLTFITREATFVRGVLVDGVADPPNPGQLVNASKLQLGTRYSDSQIKQAVENLLELLRVNGFYKATIQTQTVPQPAQQIDISFHVDSGQRARFDMPIIKGDPHRPVDDLVNATHWKKLYGLLGWNYITEQRVTQGLDRIRKSYQKKDFLMAKVALDRIDYREDVNRGVPILEVNGGPQVQVRTIGAKVSKGTLRTLVPVYEEQSVDKDLLVEGKRNLTEYFESKGFFDAEVDFDIGKSDKGEELIEFSIAKGSRHKLVSLEITGNKYFNTQTLRERMYITPATFIRFRNGRYSRAFLKRDINAISDLYKSNGFRDVEVTYTAEDDYQAKPQNLALLINIKEGPQWFVNKLEIVGVPDNELEQVKALLHSTEGQPYSDFNVATDQDAVLNYYFNNGYPDAKFEATVTPAAVPYRMDLKYTVKLGMRRFVREVLISGLKTSSPDLVNSRISLKPGDPLSQVSMIESQRRLYDLGIFARVDTALQNPDGAESNKYVLYRMEEARKYSFTVGIGAEIARIGGGSQVNLDAPAGTAGFSPRVSFGVNRTNFLGVGHTISLQTRVSNIERRAVLTYLAPQFKGNEKTNLTFTGVYDDARDIRTFSSKREEGSAQLGRRLSKANSIQYRIGYRHVTIDKNTLKITPQLIPLLDQPVNLGIVSTTFIQDRRDDPSDAHRGIYNTLDVAFAASIFGTMQLITTDPVTGLKSSQPCPVAANSQPAGQCETSRPAFTRVLGRNATYHRIGKDLVFARVLSIGSLVKASPADVPLPERFFAGGATSHRGFAENQAGPRDLVTGFPVGGKALLINTLELRFPLIGENIGAVVFHDAGNVYSTFSKISLRSTQRNLTDFDYMIHAVGFGIRYRTPIGPLRLDLAYGINTPRFVGFQGTRDQLLFGGGVRTEQRLSHFQFHFSLGQAF